jgi:hypothetical protein
MLIYFQLSDPHVWGLFVSDLGVVFGNQLLAQYGPTYLKNVVCQLSPKHTIHFSHI